VQRPSVFSLFSLGRKCEDRKRWGYMVMMGWETVMFDGDNCWILYKYIYVGRDLCGGLHAVGHTTSLGGSEEI
jgi:hypothetical protein